jgi:hypothetical protein
MSAKTFYIEALGIMTQNTQKNDNQHKNTQHKDRA